MTDVRPCPSCGEPPAAIIGSEQAICGSLESLCQVVFYNPQVDYTPEDMINAHIIDTNGMTGNPHD